MKTILSVLANQNTPTKQRLPKVTMEECQRYESIFNRLTKDFKDKHHWPSWPRWFRELGENSETAQHQRLTGNVHCPHPGLDFRLNFC